MRNAAVGNGRDVVSQSAQSVTEGTFQQRVLKMQESGA